MTDNYRDEMREARESVRKIGIYAMDMPPGNSRDWLEQELRSLDAALSRLSARAEPAKDAREFVRDWIVANHGVLSMAGTAAQDLIVRLQARLSASEQGEGRDLIGTMRMASTLKEIEKLSVVGAMTPLGMEEALNGIHKMAGMALYQPAVPAPEMGEAKRCAWCGGVFSLTTDGHLTCGKCGKQINPEAYRDPSEIEIHTPADDFYKAAPALPAPSEEKPNPEFHIEDALKTIKYNDSVANIRLYATVALESALKDLAALRSRLSEPKE